jgi:hypothetical protein
MIAVPKPKINVPKMGTILEVQRSSDDRYTNESSPQQTNHTSKVQLVEDTATSNTK